MIDREDVAVPPGLDGVVADRWRETVGLLQELGTWRPALAGAVLLLSEAWGRYESAKKDIGDDRVVSRPGKDGTEIISRHPAHVTLERAAVEISKWMGVLGLAPAAAPKPRAASNGPEDVPEEPPEAPDDCPEELRLKIKSA